MKFNFKISAIISLSVLLLSCTSDPKRKENQRISEIMNNTEYKNQIQEIELLKKSMTEYMDFAEPSYTEKDIEKCKSILIEFIQNIDKTSNREEGLKIVQSTILELNELNKKCDFDLIETNEREQIAGIIIGAGNQKGYNTLSEGITEEWREW